MDDHPTVIHAFQHCQIQPVFYHQMPRICSVCSTPLVQGSFRREPWGIFPPWASSAEFPNSIVIKATDGKLRNYNIGDALHVGLSDSNGYVTHFSEDGVCVDDCWEECLKVDLTYGMHTKGLALDPALRIYWENCIAVHKISWRLKCVGLPYDDEDNNCFDFVWNFCRQLLQSQPIQPELSDALHSCHTKIDFTEKFVTRTMSKLLQYLRVLRQCMDL